MGLLSVGTNSGMQGSSGSLQSSYNPQKTAPTPQKTVSAQYLQPTVNPMDVYSGGGGYTAPYTPPAPAPDPVYYYANGSVAPSAAAVQKAADTAAYYDDEINQLKKSEGRLDNQYNVGYSNINDSYNLAENRLNQQKGIGQRNYDTQTGQNMQNYSQTRTGILNNTHATANALQRLLGMNGAGNSSAAFEQAPYAAGLQGSQNLNSAQHNYSGNQNALKTNWDDFQMQYNNNLEDARNQKYSQTNALKSSIAETRANLLDQIRQAGIQKDMANGDNYETAASHRDSYQSKIDNLLNSIAGLSDQYAHPVIKTGAVNYKAANLNPFSLGHNDIQTDPGAASNLDPTFLGLIDPTKQRDEFGNLIG